MVQISASLLAADFARLGEEVRRAEASGVDSFHFDIMDGHYAPNIALAPQHFIALRSHTRLEFHAHLELANPDDVLERFAPLEADAIIVMRDTLPNPYRTFNNIRAQGKKVGLSLNPDEQLSDVQEYFPLIDELIILGVLPGFGGQKIQANTIAKISEARRIVNEAGLKLPIHVDGGVTLANAAQIVRAGADALIIGSAIFQAPDMCAFVDAVKATGVT
jgi:ribulose-phosphate 3-epimerase